MAHFDFSNNKRNLLYEILVYLFMIAFVAIILIGYVALMKLFIFIIMHL